MSQICAQIPVTLLTSPLSLSTLTTTAMSEDNNEEEIMLAAGQLSTSFFLQTFIHAKEKPTLVQWMELLTKQLLNSTPATLWFLNSCASPGKIKSNKCLVIVILYSVCYF
jgi:hypothetical protein